MAARHGCGRGWCAVVGARGGRGRPGGLGVAGPPGLDPGPVQVASAPSAVWNWYLRQNQLASACLSQTPRFGRISLGVDQPREACRSSGSGRRGGPVANLVLSGATRYRNAAKSRPAWPSPTGRCLLVDQEMGAVRRLSGKATLAILQGHVAAGPRRSSTAGGRCWENAQPVIQIDMDATRDGMAVAAIGKLTHRTAGVRRLIPQESPPCWSAPPRVDSDVDVVTELLTRASDPWLADATLYHALPGGSDRDGRRRPHRSRQGLRAAWGTGSCPRPIPNAAVEDPTRCRVTQLPALPLSNPEPEVVR
jgi:hypothetical protein